MAPYVLGLLTNTFSGSSQTGFIQKSLQAKKEKEKEKRYSTHCVVDDFTD